jgi:uncharacterized protein (DUF58 family)
MEGFLETTDTLSSRQFHIAVKRLADSLSYGTDRSPFLGSGLEYVQSRPYQWGAPIRSIDWRITGKTGRIHVKEYEAPKRLPCYLLIDTSASMTVASTARSKYATALFIAGGLAFACLDRASPVGVIGVGSREFRIEPSLSADQVMQWLHRLRHYRFDETTAIATKLGDLANRLPCRSLIMLLSDLHQPEAEPAIKLMAQRHDCIVLQLRDPAESGLPGIGFFRGQEAETGRLLTGHGRMKWLEHRNVAETLRRAGIDHLTIDIDQPYAHELRYFLQARNVLSRGAR